MEASDGASAASAALPTTDKPPEVDTVTGKGGGKENVRRPARRDNDDDEVDTLPAGRFAARFKAAETTQLVVTTTKPASVSRAFGRGTQFLATTYLGEQAAISAVWARDGDAATTAASAAADSKDASENDVEGSSKGIEAMPTAQHLPPGANAQLAEKKSKAKPTAGRKGSKDDDGDDDDGGKDDDRGSKSEGKRDSDGRRGDK
jgi:hypothetical protein